jgi:beta-1,4-mannosyl-glycoprotein beta-1,4-N-acetylglucosaminyltransferase
LRNNRIGTINGTPKPLYFKDQLYDRFDQFQYKIVYHELLSPPPYDHAYPSPSAWAAHERDQMTSLLRTRVYNTVLPPIVIFAAPDEIAYPSTLRLMRECVFPSPMHLQMRRYLYSFEWPLGWRSWEAQVHVWDTRTVEKEKEKEAESKQGEGGVEGEKEGEEADEDAEALAERKRKEAVKEEKWKTEYGHGKVSEWALADAGWHCSHCMKKLDDVLEKVKGKVT